MKFAEYLSTHTTPEWRSQYIRYDDMKEILIQTLVKAQGFDEQTDKKLRDDFLMRVDEHFLSFCDEELSKIKKFFTEKLNEASKKWETLKSEASQLEKLQIRNSEFRSTISAHSSDSNLSVVKKSSEENFAAKLRKRIASTEEHLNIAPIVRAIPDRLIEKTREKRHKYLQQRKFGEIKLAFSEFYLMLVLLHNYQTLNATGFRKILKKHDKMFDTDRGNSWRTEKVDRSELKKSNQLQNLIREVEHLYAETFESGNRAKAMKSLRVPPVEEQSSPRVTFRVGIFVGMIFLLLPLVVFIGVYLHDEQSTKPLAWREALFLYRSTFLILLLIVFIGLDTLAWSKFGVNHVLIFEIDPRNHLNYQRFLEIGTFLMVLWFLSFSGFILASYFDLHPFSHPLCLVTLMILLFFNPTPTMYRESRFWLLRTMGRVVCAPFYRVGFRDFWLADQLVSLELLFFDINYFACFYSYDVSWWPVPVPVANRYQICVGWRKVTVQTFLMALPSWFRFAQSLRRYYDTKQRFPHLFNAGKYGLGIVLIAANSARRATASNYYDHPATNPYLYVWIVIAFINTCIKFYWDVKMDWGLFSPNAGENKFLRENLVYRAKIYYYLAIVQNFFLRFAWIANAFLAFNTIAAEYADLIGFIYGILEVYRRFIWNLFRVENEHINNCGKFRAVRDIQVIPLATILDTFVVDHEIDDDGSQNELKKRKKNHSFNTLTTKAIIINDDSNDPDIKIIKTPIISARPKSPVPKSNPKTEIALVSFNHLSVDPSHLGV